MDQNKRKYLRVGGVILLAVVLSFIASSYVREIQVKIHQGIGFVYKNVNDETGDILYDVNGFIFNGKGFDTERDIKHTIHQNFRSVVSIKLASTDQSFIQNLGGQGTGFFVKVTDTHGYIATNYHVVERAIILPKNIKMTVNTATDWWTYDAEVIGVDPVADFALIKIEKKENEEWHALEFVDRVAEDVVEGDVVVVVGHGMSLPYTATSGMVNYVNRFGTGIYTLHMQIDAVINQGNSGGPVLNTEGKVIGIITSILSPGRSIPGWDGVGLAVISDLAVRSMNYIMEREGEEMVKWVPYSITPYKFSTFTYEEILENGQLELDKKDRKMLYASMDEHGEGTAAYDAGLREGDLIIEVNDEKVYGPLHMIYHALMALPGDMTKVKVLRGDEFTGYEEFTFEFEVGEKDPEELREWIAQRDARSRPMMSDTHSMKGNCASCHSMPKAEWYPYPTN
tara:strand:- start:4947 stop:6308 length:1362 start_codon:yes stop_codon:yes gene_type:complete